MTMMKVVDNEPVKECSIYKRGGCCDVQLSNPQDLYIIMVRGAQGQTFEWHLLDPEMFHQISEKATCIPNRFATLHTPSAADLSRPFLERVLRKGSAERIIGMHGLHRHRPLHPFLG